jgi:uncharacterized protein (DUF342 family)
MQKGYYKLMLVPVIDRLQVQIMNECLFEDKVILSKIQARDINPTIVEKGTKLFESVPQKELRNFIENQNKVRREKCSLSEYYKISSAGENIIGDNTEESFYSAVTGIFVCLDEVPAVIPIHCDSVYELLFSTDKFRLDINIYPPYKDGRIPDAVEIVEKLKSMSVKAEIQVDNIIDALLKLTETHQPQLNVNAANGIKPVDGKDGYIEYFVFRDGIGPSIDEFGRTDYKNLNLVVPVEKDQKILEYHPLVPGMPGRNIFGEAVFHKEGEKCLFPGVENTYKSPLNSNILLSKIDGSAFFKRSSLTISADYYIPGDIDYSTGNIHSNGSVRVSGDVKAGFQLDVGGNLSVGGCVEDAIINCKGSVTIKQGFIGTGKGVINCEGNVKCHFINQQTIFARDSIIIEGECLDANLFAKNSIKVGGAKISIVGGYTIAGKSLETEFLGNMYNVKTLVELGYDYKLKEELKKNKSLQDELNEKLKKVKLIYIKLERLDELTEEQQKMHDLMKEQNDLMEKHIADLEKRNNEINKLIKTPSKSTVKVKKKIFPGVIISINSHKLIIQEERLNSTFGINEEGEVLPL